MFTPQSAKVHYMPGFKRFVNICKHGYDNVTSDQQDKYCVPRSLPDCDSQQVEHEDNLTIQRLAYDDSSGKTLD